MFFVMQTDRRWIAAGVALSLLVTVAIVTVIRSVKRPHTDLLDFDSGGVGFDCSQCTMVPRVHGSSYATPRDNNGGCSLDPNTKCRYTDNFVELEAHKQQIAVGPEILPRCANLGENDSQVECCEAPGSDSMRLACPEMCFTGTGSGWDALINRMKTNSAGCFQNLNETTGLLDATE